MSMRSTLLLPKLISEERELVRLIYLEAREGAGRSSGGGPIVP